MQSPIVLITLGAVAGAVIGIIDGGGGIGRGVSDMLASTAAPVYRAFEQFKTAPPAPRRQTANLDGDTHSVFSVCMSRNGANMESTLRDLVEFHEHDATVSLVGCLLDGAPARFCTSEGRRQAADAMEIYFWSRDDARRTSPAHGMAAKIHLLDRAATSDDTPDPFALTWSGPTDKAIFERLRVLTKQGYLDPGAFAFSGRAELREALRDVKPEGEPCATVAGVK